RVAGEHGHGFLDVLGLVAVHDDAIAAFQLPGAVAHFEDDGVAAVPQHGGFEVRARAQGGVEEHHREQLVREDLLRRGLLPGRGLGEDARHAFGAEIFEMGDVSGGGERGHAASCEKAWTASTSAESDASETVSGGISRTTDGSLDPPARMRRRKRWAFSAAASPVSKPSSRPWPRTARMEVPASWF